MVVLIYHIFVCAAEQYQSTQAEFPSDETRVDLQGEEAVSLQLLIGVQIRPE